MRVASAEGQFLASPSVLAAILILFRRLCVCKIFHYFSISGLSSPFFIHKKWCWSIENSTLSASHINMGKAFEFSVDSANLKFCSNPFISLLPHHLDCFLLLASQRFRIIASLSFILRYLFVVALIFVPCPATRPSVHTALPLSPT